MPIRILKALSRREIMAPASVEIWDHGYYTDNQNSGKKTEQEQLKALRAGHLKIVLHGNKLKGEFTLVKLKTAKDNSWLLIKHKDEYAVREHYDSEAYTTQTLSNQSISKSI